MALVEISHLVKHFARGKGLFRRGSLVRLKVPFLKMERKFFILVHKRKYRTTTARQFIELCQQHMAAGLRDLLPLDIK